MRKYILFLFYTIPIFNMYGQDSTQIQQSLEEFTVTATKTSISFKHIAQSVFSLSKERISELAPQTTADLLQKTGMITVQKSQQGGGSPILRGLEANRVLLVIDGVRMNNIIYRGGHLQNLITVDPNILERAEVLFGPSSSVYGSDALGGAIHLISKTPQYKIKNTFNSNLNTRYSTVNQEKMIHYDLTFGSTKTAALFSATYTDYGDLNGGRNKNQFYDKRYGDRLNYYTFQDGKDVLVTNRKPWKQIATGYRQLDLTGKVRYQKGSADHLINLQYSNSSDIPRYDRLTDVDSKTVLRNSAWYYGPQKRFMASYVMDYTSSFPVKLNINYQSVEESRHNRRVGNYNLQSRIENVQIFGFDLFHQQSYNTNQWVIGVDGQYETVKSTAFLTNLISAVKSPLDTRYPGGFNRMARAGAYTILTHHFSDRWNMQESIRVGLTNLSSDFGTNDFFKFPFQQVRQSNFVYSGNIGVNYSASQSSHWGLVLASGFRVPNVDDLAKVFESVAGTLIVPNPDLKPEKSLSLELNYKHYFKDQKSFFRGSIYSTNLYNAIVTRPFTYNGSDSVVYNGKQSIVLANQNKRLAKIFGVTLEGRSFLNTVFNIHYASSYTYGRIKETALDSPLDHIPPWSGLLGLEYKPDNWNFELNTLINAKKNIDDYLLNAEDNEIYATPIGMPAWMIVNLYTSYKVGPNFSVQASLENILDTQYRVFASGINAPGRNLSLSARMTF